MKNPLSSLFIFILMMLSLTGFSQMYILNEDFSTATGTTPPANWQNITITGQDDAKWRFNNPGNRTVNFPVTSPFAILDAPQVSPDTSLEVVTLETPSFDASIGLFFLLFFDHYFLPDSAATAKILAFDGTDWIEVASFDYETAANPTSEVIDLTEVIAGNAEAKLRFTWTGHGKGYWALDNVRIYSALYLDAGISNIDSPVMPFEAGSQDIKVSLTNFGYQTLSTAIIKWSVNGVMQPQLSWNGSIPYGSAVSDINIGTYNFQSGEVNQVKVWSEMPNGNPDPNFHNDSTIRILSTALCGIYTIGGENPDFITFNAAVNQISVAGISCPVVFKVRDGIYNERLVLTEITGSTESNTVTFKSENDDSTKVLLTSEVSTNADFLINFNNSHNIIIKGLKLSIQQISNTVNLFKFTNGSSNIHIKNCNLYCFTWTKSMFNIMESSHDIVIENNYITGWSGRASMLSATDGAHHILFKSNKVIDYVFSESTAIYAANAFDLDIESNEIKNIPQGFYIILIEGCQSLRICDNLIEECPVYSAIRITNSIGDTITGNKIDNSTGIYLSGNTNSYCVGNKIYRANDVNGLHIKSGNATVGNNFIHIDGELTCAGIFLEQVTPGSDIVFNSVNVTNSNLNTAALRIEGSSGFSLKDNIFSNKASGYAIEASVVNFNDDWNYNNYFNNKGGFAIVNDEEISSLDDWKSLTGADSESFSVNPYFSPDTLCDINQSFLNDEGLPVTAFIYDIDSTLRNPVTPDIGAKEYAPCAIDAGIERFSAPLMPITGGFQTVKVILHNHGTDPLNSVNIYWSVDGMVQPTNHWTGSLSFNQTGEVQLGNFDFTENPFAEFVAWTGEPNSINDCNQVNDSTLAYLLAAPLCGNYTIGGTAPDFTNFTEAVTALKMAGITCAVTFLVRPGVYNEQIEIDSIAGATESTPITFQSETEDSLSVTLTYQGSSSLDYLVKFNHAQHVIFKKLTVRIQQTSNTVNLFRFSNSSGNIQIQNCNLYCFTWTKSMFNIMESSHDIVIENNYITGWSGRASMFNAADNSFRVLFKDNMVDNYILSEASLVVLTNAEDITFELNRIQNCYGSYTGFSISSCNTIKIIGNTIINNNWTHKAINSLDSQNDSISYNIIDNSKGIINSNCHHNVISSNRISGIQSEHAIVVNSDSTMIANNYIVLNPENILSCLNIESLSNETKIIFNSLIASNDFATPLLIQNSNRYIIKNNIFYHKNGGSPVIIDQMINNSELDNNNYFSTSGIVGKYLGNIYMQFPSWSAAISGEANGNNLNPYFVSNTSYKVYQCGLNGAAIPIPGVLDDIEGEIRSELAPDIGCDEFEFPSHLFGIVFHDVNQNGVQDDNEYGLPGRLISIQPGNIIAMTDSTGIWTDDYVPAGTYTAAVYVPENWELSTSQEQSFFFMDTTVTTRVPSFGMYSTEPCPKAEVTITAPELIRCFPEQKVYITAKNNITATGALTGSYVDIELDPLLSLDSATLAYTAISENKYRFNIGDLNPGEEVDFDLSTTVSCSALNSQTLCMQAGIFPVDSCAVDTIYNPPIGVSPCTLPWDKSSIKVEGWCADDTVYYTVTNKGKPGEGDMVCYSPVRVYLDGSLYHFDSIQLVGGQTALFKYPGNGQTWRLEADQHPLHPGHSHPNASVEACGNIANWTPGLINDFPQDDAEPIVDIYCGMITGDWEPVDKTGYPKGLEEEGYILPGQGLQYLINFQNTGIDTAEVIVIRDTLDINLNIFTVQTGTSSHPFTFRMYGPRILEWRFDHINLPPASDDEMTSQGFLTFQVDQNDGLVEGTQINNKADIYFEYKKTIVNGMMGSTANNDETIFTNITLHTINHQLLQPLPSAAGTISGLTSVCQGETSVSYTVPEIYNATAYIWSLPAGITGSSTTNSITVDYGHDAISGNIVVHGTNPFGDGATSFLVINVKPETIPGAVTGGTFISLGSPTDTLVLSGHRGAVIIWQRSYNSEPYSNIAATEGLLKYAEVPLSDGTWKYRAVVQNDSCNVENSLYTTVEVINGPIARSWTGAIDEKWHLAGNWSPVGVPGPDDDVLIPLAVPHMPEVKVLGVSCKKVTIQPGARLNITNGVTITIDGVESGN
jgi:hypothetical protein